MKSLNLERGRDGRAAALRLGTAGAFGHGSRHHRADAEELALDCHAQIARGRIEADDGEGGDDGGIANRAGK